MQADEPLNYCEDCQFCSIPDTGKAFARCTKGPRATVPDRFVSREFDQPRFASAVRSDAAQCGPGAIWFEAKPAAQVAA